MTPTIESRTLHTAADVHAMRADEAFSEGAIAVMSFPHSDPVAYISHDNPKVFGERATVGDTVHKGPAGDFEVEIGAAA